MKKKNLLQAILLFLIFILIIIFFFFFNFNQSKNNQTKKEQFKNIESLNKDDNLIRGIQYISKDTSGNIYKIIAENGKNDLSDDDLIYLSGVNANIKLHNFKELKISSDFAQYNNLNNFTKFYDNVILKFENNTILCSKIVLDFDQGFANVSDNIVFKNLNTTIVLDRILIDFNNKTTRMSMFKNSDKIKMITNNVLN